MSFQALARTWRPRRFEELVGQDHVVRALTHALNNDKLHHALLFSGTRGVGKTTLARIIAKCLNCEHGVSAHPCLDESSACDSCREIAQGRYVDLIEVDAASRTGVDDTRDLMDNVQYAPTRGRTKVYLIDEVHMLTKHSFNALLKTLEEPPPRVQFLLATTEPEKIPVTILSRCLQFPLKRLPVAQISARLAHVIDAESLTADDGALTEIARAADGSMRDGLSLLDQAIAFGGGALATGAVQEMLGTIGTTRVRELVQAIINGRAAAALEALEALYGQGVDMRYLLDALATAWQQIAVIQIVGPPSDIAGDETGASWQDAAREADAATVQLYYDITLTGVRDFVYAPDPLVGVKMTVLRMLAFDAGDVEPAAPPTGESGEPEEAAPAQADARGSVARLREHLNKPPQDTRRAASAASPPPTQDNGAAGRPVVPDQPPRPAPASEHPASEHPASEHPGSPRVPATDAVADLAPASMIEPATATATATAEPPVETRAPAPDQALGDANGAPVAAGDHPQDWHRLVARMRLTGFAAQLADNGICRHLDEQGVVLEVARVNAFLATPSAREALAHALGEIWAPRAAPSLKLEVVDAVADTPAMRTEQDAERRQLDAVASIENDPIVKQLREQLGARLRPETIKPIRAHQAIHDKAVQQRDDP